MAKWPKMISTKDVAYISDMFNWNDTLEKRLNFYLNSVEDKELLKNLEDTLKVIQQNKKNLVQIVKDGE